MALPRSYRALVGQGYLPKELPPAFTSETMRRYIPSNPVTIGTKPLHLAKSEQAPYTFSIPAVQARRRLEIPSPAAFSRLAYLMAQNWREIGKLLDRSKISLSRPVLNRNSSGRALVDRHDPTQQRIIRLRQSRRGTVTTHLDTSNFYGSIYTHAVDWAVRGKAAAKLNRVDNSLGRLLDFCLQQSRDGQTAGIAIGPETSRIISEIVMAAVDEELVASLPWVVKCSVRYIDDVTLYADGPLKSLEFVTAYLSHLSRYELTLNDHKTRELSHVEPPDPHWRAQTLRAIRDMAATRRPAGIISIISSVLDIARVAGSPAPLRYFLSSTPKRALTANNWLAFQDFLTIAIRSDGITLAHAHQFLVRAKDQGFLGQFRDLETNLYQLIDHHISVGNEFEVAAAINILTDIGTVVETTLAERAGELESDLVDLLLLEASAKAKRLKGVKNAVLDRGSDVGAFSAGHWMLAYEVQRAHPDRRTSEFKAGEWAALSNAEVSFIRDPSESPMSRWYLTRLAARTHRTEYSHR